VTLEAEDGRVGRYSFAPANAALPEQPLELPEGTLSHRGEAVPTVGTENREKKQTVTLSGKLLSQPREGNPDRRGKPTAWATFGAHEEGRDDARVYLASFHAHTARIALGLPAGSSITVTGYPHPSADPNRKETLSVMNIVAYEGKPEKAAGAPRRRRKEEIA